MKLLQRWKHTAVHNQALVLTSILVAFGTLFYAGAVVVQIRLMNRASRDSAAQVERLAQASDAAIKKSVESSNEALTKTLAQNKVSFDAVISQAKASLIAQVAQSKTALDASIAASHLGSRAWISASYAVIGSVPPEHALGSVINAIDPIKEFKPHTIMAIRVDVKNIGQTPAKEVRAKSFGFLLPAGTREQMISGSNFSFQAAMKSPFNEPATIANGQTMTIISKEIPGLSEPVISSLIAGTRMLTLSGLIEYKDVFSEEVHQTEFCFMFNGKTAGYSYCGNHSEMH